MTSSSEQTTALIATARVIAQFSDSGPAQADVIGSLADALESATKEPETTTCLECEGEGAFNVTFVYGNQRVTCEDCQGTGRVLVVSPRVVSTVAELDALPVGSVIRTADGGILEKHQVLSRSPWWALNAGTHQEFPWVGSTVLWVGGTE